MGGAASVVSEEEVRAMDSEQLATYALENKIADYVAETIKTNQIDGDVAYELDEPTIDGIAGQNLLQKKKLLSALHSFPGCERKRKRKRERAGANSGGKPLKCQKKILCLKRLSILQRKLLRIGICLQQVPE